MIYMPEEDVTHEHIHHPPSEFVRHEPDTLAPILAVARAQGCAPPTAIHVRQTTWDRIFNESNHTICTQDVKDVEGIEVVIDDTIPVFPGFEIHREIW